MDNRRGTWYVWRYDAVTDRWVVWGKAPSQKTATNLSSKLPQGNWEVKVMHKDDGSPNVK